MKEFFLKKRINPLFRRPVRTAWCAVVMSVGIMFGASSASAQFPPGPGVDDEIRVDDAQCMQEATPFSLGCTANDIQIAGVVTEESLCPSEFWDSEIGACLRIEDDGCAYPGDDVTFTATFEVVTTAKRRHDIGIYFSTDGDPNMDGALTSGDGITGQNVGCSVFTMPYANEPAWLDLDGTTDSFAGTNTDSGIQDTCGDIDKPAHNPLYPTLTLTAACVDFDNNGTLNLPNCTSWRQAGSNELCLGPLDTFPGSPSKCRCDEGFEVPIDVPPASLLVSKMASPTSVDEPGGSVTFSVKVTNTGVDPNNPVTLNTLDDDIYNNITTTAHDGITATTCSVPQVIPADDGNVGGIDTYECTFTAFVDGNGGTSETDTVTASGVDDRGNTLSGEASATVTIDDVQPTISVSKLANGVDSAEVLEPGADVTFSVSVTNNSVSTDPVTVDTLVDDIYLDITSTGGEIKSTTCAVPQEIPPGGTYSCSFVAFVGDNYQDSETDTVTASGTDDEESPVSDSDSAMVTVTDVPSDISLDKTVSPETVDEPGGSVTYSYKVTNTSTVDTVFIDTLIDDKLGDLDGKGTCDVTPDVELAPGGTYSCTVTTNVTGNAFATLTNEGIASGVDDDGAPVTAKDPATVTFGNVEPDAALTKVAKAVLVTYEVTVTNMSDAEQLTLRLLSDDTFGDITAVQGAVERTDCSVAQALAINGESGDTYICTFDAKVTSSPHTNIVTGTVDDDDGSNADTPADSATVTFK